jgi:hypothetical protein
MINKQFRRDLLRSRIAAAIVMIDELVQGEPPWLATLGGLTGMTGRLAMIVEIKHDIELYEEELRFLDRP